MLGNIKITHKGKVHTVRFNVAARFYLLNKLGISNTQLAASLNSLGTFGLLRSVTYAGIVGWAEQNMQEPSMSEKEVAEYLADAPDEKVAEIFSAFNEWFMGASSTDQKKSKAKPVAKT